ncbi:DUF4395 domain-containing protein [Pseudonocardia sp. HH130630-07]|uniref:DUF4395 domain-containing protein n=1 Tax=Pseudonocardia sp. HH130630-07 TaxID=1690815 RepID=UPI000814BCAF|nr:DUF4395 domain-containing protein [Pseudonocardia sp. HH130630-07]ANY06409.1 hypothetical protein AFB00_09010 [Pseudonocardia sp. HH130630-07]
MSVTDLGPVHLEPRLDPRGIRFSAGVSAAVLALVLLSGSGLLATAQAVVLAVGAFAGMRFAPYGVLYRHLLAPRLEPVSGGEDAAPARFAQAAGLVVATAGAIGYLSGLTTLGAVATASMLVVALLTAATGYCPGRELYGLLARLRTGPAGAHLTVHHRRHRSGVLRT